MEVSVEFLESPFAIANAPSSPIPLSDINNY